MNKAETQIHNTAKVLANAYRKAEKEYVSVVNPHYKYSGPKSIKYKMVDGSLNFVVVDEEGVFKYTEQEFKDRISSLLKDTVAPKIEKEDNWIEV